MTIGCLGLGFDFISPITHDVYDASKGDLDASIGAGLVYASGVESDDISVGVAHGGSLDLGGTGLADLDGLGRFLRPGNFFYSGKG